MAKCIWLTGLPCSGKTTIANAIEKYFANSIILDGDRLRNSPLANTVGFSEEDRKAHILRMGYLAKMFVDKDITTICSFVSPYKETRNLIRSTFNPGQFVEVYLSTPLNVCETRDVKGMYAAAKSGKIKEFTGVSAPYEIPECPEISLDTSALTLEQTKDFLYNHPAINPHEDKAALFIGRWNGVFHLGHQHIIQQKLDEGKRVILAIRDVRPNEKNPWTAREVKEMLDFQYEDNINVTTLIIPDIESVEYGRNVGYAVNEIKVSSDIAGISGTEIRRMISEGDSQWKNRVPAKVATFLLNKYDSRDSK